MPDVKHFDPGAVVGTVQQLLWRRGWAGIGIRDVVDTTGVGRSSLYATFGSKRELFLVALRRYVSEHAFPAFEALESGGRGLSDIEDFFGRLIGVRCAGPRARWGCLVTNLQAAGIGREPEVADVLTEHNARLLSAFGAALGTAAGLGQLEPRIDPDAAAEQLALLAHGINLRSKAGADARTLRAAVACALDGLRRPDDT